MNKTSTAPRMGLVSVVAIIMIAYGTGCQTQTGSKLAARDGFDAAAADPPFTADTHFAAGQFAETQGNLTVAADQYEKAIKIRPTDTRSLYRLGILYTEMKRYSDAVGIWKQYCSVNDGNATAWSNLGFCAELAGRNDDAEAAYRKGITKDSKNAPCRVNYGLMLARIGHVNESIIQLQVVLNPSQVHYNIGSVLEQQGKKELARQEYQKALDLNPAFTDARTRMAQINGLD